MTDAGKKALEELVADDTKNPPTIWLQSWEDTRGEGQDRMWCEDKVWPDHEDDHEPVKYVRADLVATFEARAIARLQADLKEAVEALKPFAEEANEWNADALYSPIMETGDSAKFTVGDLHRAAAIRAKIEEVKP